MKERNYLEVLSQSVKELDDPMLIALYLVACRDIENQTPIYLMDDLNIEYKDKTPTELFELVERNHFNIYDNYFYETSNGLESTDDARMFIECRISYKTLAEYVVKNHLQEEYRLPNIEEAKELY